MCLVSTLCSCVYQSLLSSIYTDCLLTPPSDPADRFTLFLYPYPGTSHPDQAQPDTSLSLRNSVVAPNAPVKALAGLEEGVLGFVWNLNAPYPGSSTNFISLNRISSVNLKRTIPKKGKKKGGNNTYNWIVIDRAGNTERSSFPAICKIIGKEGRKDPQEL